jgi:hypothetical protein
MAQDVVTRFGKGAEETLTANFTGCDGKSYRVVIRGDKLYVNGADVRSPKDGPCEYAGHCPGNNEHCSRIGRVDKGPDEDCTFHTENKLAEGYKWDPDKGWVKKAQ